MSWQAQSTGAGTLWPVHSLLRRLRQPSYYAWICGFRQFRVETPTFRTPGCCSDSWLDNNTAAGATTAGSAAAKAAATTASAAASSAASATNEQPDNKTHRTALGTADDMRKAGPGDREREGVRWAHIRLMGAEGVQGGGTLAVGMGGSALYSGHQVR